MNKIDSGEDELSIQLKLSNDVFGVHLSLPSNMTHCIISTTNNY